ncbi:MAG: glycerol-3-phosphate dehydrogenase C-terminal domain-containing protein, partial [Pseudomonadota bacterium]
APLPGGSMPNADFAAWFEAFQSNHPWLPAPLAKHLAQTYGTDAERLLDGRTDVTDLGQHFGGQCYAFEIDWLMEHEWARTAEDALTRRTKHGISLSEPEREGVAAYMADHRSPRISASA